MSNCKGRPNERQKKKKKKKKSNVLELVNNVACSYPSDAVLGLFTKNIEGFFNWSWKNKVWWIKIETFEKK
jgi:hypothetical protein